MKLVKIITRRWESKDTVYDTFHHLKPGTFAIAYEVDSLGHRDCTGMSINTGRKIGQYVPRPCYQKIKCTKANLRAFAKQFKEANHAGVLR